MKKETLQERSKIINNSLYYMYENLHINITLDDLAKQNSVSKYHFHRIFKEETKENFSNYLTSMRLQKAASILISNKYSTITEILINCGYSSNSSFVKAFKKRFKYTPSQWRKGKYREYSKDIHQKKFVDLKLEADIQIKESIHCAYIRHKGYDKTLKKTWQKLRALAYELNIKNYDEIGLHHDNPSITPLEQCKYVAAISLPNNIKTNRYISTFHIPKHLYAIFHYKGQYGEIIEVLQYINQLWIIDTGYEITTLPIYIKYKKNHLIDENEFDIEINVPIKVI